MQARTRPMPEIFMMVKGRDTSFRGDCIASFGRYFRPRSRVVLLEHKVHSLGQLGHGYV